MGELPCQIDRTRHFIVWIDGKQISHDIDTYIKAFISLRKVSNSFQGVIEKLILVGLSEALM